VWLVWAGQGVEPGDGAQPPRRRVPNHVPLTWFARHLNVIGMHLPRDRHAQTFWPVPWMGWISNPCARDWSEMGWGWLLVMRWVNCYIQCSIVKLSVFMTSSPAHQAQKVQGLSWLHCCTYLDTSNLDSSLVHVNRATVTQNANVLLLSKIVYRLFIAIVCCVSSLL